MAGKMKTVRQFDKSAGRFRNLCPAEYLKSSRVIPYLS